MLPCLDYCGNRVDQWLVLHQAFSPIFHWLLLSTISTFGAAASSVPQMSISEKGGLATRQVGVSRYVLNFIFGPARESTAGAHQVA